MVFRLPGPVRFFSTPFSTTPRLQKLILSCMRLHSWTAWHLGA
jgi:hypothetical protein